MLVLVALFAADTVQVAEMSAVVAKAEARMRIAPCDGKVCKDDPSTRYRLTNYQPSRDPDAKDRAWADDGSYCGVVGDKYCLSGGHTVFRSGQSPLQTILSNLP